jgi:pimeloyl-ACP methyl ester carboxylesterase
VSEFRPRTSAKLDCGRRQNAVRETMVASMPYAELDGLKLFYERADGGEGELLFVHGWCCDRTAFQPQFDHFARRHAVTALDLRGCGRSDCPDSGYTIPDFAEDLARFCAEVGIEEPVVVGHSLGGMIAVELAARHPSVPRALVLVDPGPIDPLPATVSTFRALAEQLDGPDGEEVRRQYVQDMGARDEALARWIVDLMCAAPLPMAAAVIHGVNAWNGVGALALCALPTLLLESALGTNPESLRLRAIKPDLEVAITVGAGHFHQLEVPEQVNAMIERFLYLVA